jgi:hypothetical protein
VLQDLYQASTIQRYPVGFQYPITDALDLRRFHYGKGANTQIPDVGSHISVTQHVSWAVIADAPVGSKTVVVTVGAGDGAAHDGAIAKDELAGGYCAITPHTANHTMLRMIKSNTAVLAPGGAMTVTLDRPTDYIIELVSHIECMANPYASLAQGNYPRQPIMGMPMVGATVGQYLWFQTWGPRWVAPQANVGVGDHNVEVVFRHDGSIDRHDPANGMLQYQQHAGFVMTIPNGAGQAAPFVFLQITP